MSAAMSQRANVYSVVTEHTDQGKSTASSSDANKSVELQQDASRRHASTSAGNNSHFTTASLTVTNSGSFADSAVGPASTADDDLHQPQRRSPAPSRGNSRVKRHVSRQRESPITAGDDDEHDEEVAHTATTSADATPMHAGIGSPSMPSVPNGTQRHRPPTPDSSSTEETPARKNKHQHHHHHNHAAGHTHNATAAAATTSPPVSPPQPQRQVQHHDDHSHGDAHADEHDQHYDSVEEVALPAIPLVAPHLNVQLVVQCGHFSMQGVRPEMEDRVTLLPHPEFNRLAGFPQEENLDLAQAVQERQRKQQKGTGWVGNEGINGANGFVGASAAATSSVAVLTAPGSPPPSRPSPPPPPRVFATRSFFAVFDGHGGDVSAEYCRQHVHNNLLTNSAFLAGDSVAGLRQALCKTEADFCAACRRINLVTSSGTTAITALIENDHLVVGNVGDSRAVLCRSGRAVDASIDHKPGRKEEKARIESLGGRVGITEEDAFRSTPRPCPCLWACVSAGRPLRVFPGGLSVSRTIGDISLKTTRLVSSEPEMFHCTLTTADEFLILACDGVWDVLSSQQAVDLVRANLFRSNENAEEASRHLANEAFRKGSTDNISVIVVTFQQPKPPPQPQKPKEKTASNKKKKKGSN